MKQLKQLNPGEQFIFTLKTEIMEVINNNKAGGTRYKRVSLPDEPGNELLAPGNVEVQPLTPPIQNKKELLGYIAQAIGYIEEDIYSAEGELIKRAKSAVSGLRKLSKAIKQQ